MCNQKVADIVEKSRVNRAYRGESAPQITVKPLKSSSLTQEEPSVTFDASIVKTNAKSSEDSGFSWLGSTNLAVGTSRIGML